LETIIINDYYGILDIVSVLGGYASSATILVSVFAIIKIMRYLYVLSLNNQKKYAKEEAEYNENIIKEFKNKQQLTKNESHLVELFHKATAKKDKRLIISQLTKKPECLKVRRAQLTLNEIGGKVGDRVNFASIYNASD